MDQADHGSPHNALARLPSFFPWSCDHGDRADHGDQGDCGSVAVTRFTGFHRANTFHDLHPLQLDGEKPKPSGFRLILKASTRPFERALNRLGRNRHHGWRWAASRAAATPSAPSFLPSLLARSGDQGDHGDHHASTAVSRFTGFPRANMARDLHFLQLDRERPIPSGFRLV
ncbi:MAG: hypothetical protein BJ554DRAFT_989 [Olpidium bornovanus]|uniref:Uncharacterized protein n=1 Tax=Olpidium bornovanus TaxID=278681 RepID=A0A8H8DHM6_9FUNG|nr:MAG: hypothetical protein BJ554DRAFT_989 [Olpidium bornovanus]